MSCIVFVISILDGLFETDENAAGDADDDDEANNDKRSNKNQNEQTIIIFWVSIRKSQ